MNANHEEYNYKVCGGGGNKRCLKSIAPNKGGVKVETFQYVKLFKDSLFERYLLTTFRESVRKRSEISSQNETNIVLSAY